jgi:hypothetical protein
MAEQTRVRILSRTNVLIGLVILILCGFLGLLILWATGATYGEEFSPDDFSRRSFSFHRSRFVPITFSGLQHGSTTQPFIQTMVSNGWIPKPPKSAAPVWHLVSDNYQPIDSTAYDARILCVYLDMQDENGQFYWEQWNKDHPVTAALLWPVISELARSYRYDLVPPLLESAMESKSDSPQDVQKFFDHLNTMLDEFVADCGLGGNPLKRVDANESDPGN